jgi:hypothetical protein
VWSDFRPENEDDLEEKTELLPQIWSSGGIPYTDQTGMKTFVETTLLDGHSHHFQGQLPSSSKVSVSTDQMLSIRRQHDNAPFATNRRN